MRREAAAPALAVEQLGGGRRYCRGRSPGWGDAGREIPDHHIFQWRCPCRQLCWRRGSGHSVATPRGLALMALVRPLEIGPL